jgi:hypothetical protein
MEDFEQIYWRRVMEYIEDYDPRPIRAIQGKHEISRQWATKLRDHGTHWVLSEIPESDVEMIFDDCMAAIDSGIFAPFSISIWIRGLAEDIIELYFSPRFQAMRKDAS